MNIMKNLFFNELKRLSLFFAFVYCCVVSVGAQSEQFLWDVQSKDINNTDFKKAMDKDGNVYIASSFPSQGRLAGQWICPVDADTNAWLRPSYGVFIAKFDTTGVMQWCRSMKDWYDGTGNVYGISVKEDRVHLMCSYRMTNIMLPWDYFQSNKHCWLHFFDTTYYSVIDDEVQPYGTLPFRYGNYGYLVTFDLDGNRMDTKTMNFLDYYGVYNCDSQGNHYVLVNIKVQPDTRQYIQLNDDTLQRFYFPLCNIDFHPQVYDGIYTPFLVKIDKEWTDVSIYPLADSLFGFRNLAGDSVFASADISKIRSFVIDSNDNMYATVTFLNRFNGIEHSLPLVLGLNNGSKVYQEHSEGDGFYPMDVIMSFDTSGRVKWTRQFFLDKYDTVRFRDIEGGYYTLSSNIPTSQSVGGIYVDSSQLYYLGHYQCAIRKYRPLYPDSVPIPNVYFDIDHRDTLSFPNEHQRDVAFVAMYDKETGEYQSHISLRSEYVNGSPCGTVANPGARPYANEDYIIIFAMDGGARDASWKPTYDNYNCTFRYNRHTGEMEIYDTITSTSMNDNYGLMVNDNGFVEKWIYNVTGSMSSANFYIPSKNQSILLYYDSLLDKRRRNVTPEDPVAVGETVQVKLDVYPNPTGGVVTVNASSPIRQIEVYDSEGRLVESGTRKTESGKQNASQGCFAATLDLSGQRLGIYIVKVQTESGIAVRKIVRM